jgi:hypothetical protein
MNDSLMPIEVMIHRYSSGDSAMRFWWDDDYAISIVEEGSGRVRLTATQGGLRSLARVLLTMAQADVADGTDLHLDPSTGLEPESLELILVKDNRIL